MEFIAVVAETVGELAAVQGRVLRRAVLATAAAVACIAFAAVTALAGATLVLYAVYLEGSALANPAVGALLAAAVAFALALAALLRANRLRRL
jgi:hypothetical protein